LNILILKNFNDILKVISIKIIVTKFLYFESRRGGLNWEDLVWEDGRSGV